MKKKRSNDINQARLMFPDMSNTFADFFCGGGGLSLGFIQAGLKCVSAMDISCEAISTYWYNLCYKGWSHLYVSSAEQARKVSKYLGDGETGNWLFRGAVPDNWLSVSAPMPCLNLFLWSILDLEPEEWMDIMNVRPGDIRIFAGGPPCQGFSTANHNRSEFDKRNRLPMRYIYYAKVCKPEIVLMENVPGLLSLGKKKGDVEGPFVRWIREAFDEAGYDMSYQVHDAADYGIPQRRKRVLFLAYRKETSDRWRDFHVVKEYGAGGMPWINVREAIGDLPPLQAGECWGGTGMNAVFHPYGYNKREGYVICPSCLKYNLQKRKHCHFCNYDLANPITGGVLRFPGLGTLIDTKIDIDNSRLRELFN
ncbi:MAG: DNA cytosine methyltransferase [Bacteroides heparinolyticus]|nr:DNA cytosine methyltransferase [Bacteroides heparinolyticus]